MTPSEFLATVLDPGIIWCQSIPGWTVPFDDRDKVLMLAIAGQESSWSERVQSGNGPAHSFYQLERTGGVTGVLTHPATKELAGECCRMMYVAPDPVHVWSVMATERGDKLATAFARLLLRTDPRPLPVLGDSHGAAEYYRANWRPGKWRPLDWPGNYEAAMAVINPPTAQIEA
jgi:hypothetical protein